MNWNNVNGTTDLQNALNKVTKSCHLKSVVEVLTTQLDFVTRIHYISPCPVAPPDCTVFTFLPLQIVKTRVIKSYASV